MSAFRLLFRVKKEERFPFFAFMVVAAFMNAAYVRTFYGYLNPFISGFDPCTLETVFCWIQSIYIHDTGMPHILYGIFLLPLYLLNHIVSGMVGFECADFVLAVVLTVNASYSFLLMFRILHEVLRVERRDAVLLSVFFFSQAIILLMIFVPEHFPFSMTVLLAILYLSGTAIRSKRAIPDKAAIVMLLLSAGITLPNGIKAILAVLFTNGRRYYRRQVILKTIVAPFLIMLTVAGSVLVATYHSYVPSYDIEGAYTQSTDRLGRLSMHKDINKKIHVPVLEDSPVADVDNVMSAEQPRSMWQKVVNTPRTVIRNYMQYVAFDNVSMSDVLVENLFGESIQFHHADLRKDLTAVVHYSHPVHYVVEFLIFLLLFTGLRMGWKDRFLQMCAAFCSVDILIHLVMHYAIQEVYIMGAHWMFVIPVSMAKLLTVVPTGKRPLLRFAMGILTAFLSIYNGFLVIKYLIF